MSQTSILEERNQDLSDENVKLLQIVNKMKAYQIEQAPINEQMKAELMQLHKDYYQGQRDLKALRDEKISILRRNAELTQKLKEANEENFKWKVEHEQLKERMQALRNLNK